MVSEDSTFQNDSILIDLNKVVSPILPASLAAFNGSNLSKVWNGWNEAKGIQPVIANSEWVNGLVGGENSFKLSLEGGSKNDWIVSPGILIGGGNFFRFNAGQFGVGGTNSAQFDSDDSVTVLISTDCGVVWTKLLKLGSNTIPALTNSMQQYSISLANFANKEVRFGFRARDGSRTQFTSDLYINGIEIASTLTQDCGPVEISFSPSLTLGSFYKDSVYAIQVRLNNFGSLPISNIPVSVKFSDGQILSNNFSTPIASGQTQIVSMGNFTAGAVGNNLIGKIYSGLIGDQAIINDTLNFSYSIAIKTGSKPAFKAPAFKLFPNPTHGITTLDGLQIGNKYTFVVYNFLGKQVYSKEIDSESNSFDFNFIGLSKGIYQINVSSSGQESSGFLSFIIN
jgi:hypothetical protein